MPVGGEQIRDIDDPNLRRLLEIVLTADYGPVDYTTVATQYREQVRHVDLFLPVSEYYGQYAGERFGIPPEKLRVAPLGITVIGGVITSTLLTLLVIPTVYEILADSRDWLAVKLFGPRPTN